VLDQVRPHQRIDVNRIFVLSREHHRGDVLGPAVHVAHGDLALAVGAQIVQNPPFAHFAQAVHKAVRQENGHGHEFRRVAARIPEHHPLIPGPLAVERVEVQGVDSALECGLHPLRDVGRLLMDRRDNSARGSVEPVLGSGVADALDGRANERRHVHICRRGDLSGDHHESGGDQRFTGHVTLRVVPEDGVQDCVGYLVGDLVRMALAHRLRREHKITVLHNDLQDSKIGPATARSITAFAAVYQTPRLSMTKGPVPPCRRMLFGSIRRTRGRMPSSWRNRSSTLC
jgi:hypothetical protein